MKCILMNKNTQVLEVEYNEEAIYFEKIYKVYDINHAPYSLKCLYEKDNTNDIVFRNNLSEWFKGRGIPSFRDKLDLLLHRLNIEAPSELLDKAFGLSLSDQYWLNQQMKKFLMMILISLIMIFLMLNLEKLLCQRIVMT